MRGRLMHRDYLRRLRAGTLSDEEFDRLLPYPARRASEQYWTPIEVARRAAVRFAERGTRRVLDVGCGIGKFCLVAAASRADIQWFGIDRRTSLVHGALALGGPFGLDNVGFSHGDALDRSWDEFDGIYFFNPFSENLASDEEKFDRTVALSRSRFVAELRHVDARLRALRPGVVVVTYHGLGGPLLSNFVMESDDAVGSGRLRTWVKTDRVDEPWVHLESEDQVVCAIHEHDFPPSP